MFSRFGSEVPSQKPAWQARLALRPCARNLAGRRARVYLSVSPGCKFELKRGLCSVNILRTEKGSSCFGPP